MWVVAEARVASIPEATMPVVVAVAVVIQAFIEAGHC
jgi:hypothetical protein